MPYVIRKRKNQYCVESTTTGKTHGCHDSRADAIKQQRALYKNAPPGEEAAKAAALLTALAAEGTVIAETTEEMLDQVKWVKAEELSPEMLTQAAEHLGVTEKDLLNDPGCEGAPSEAAVTMTAVEKRIPVKDVALLRMAIQRSEAQSEQEVEQAISIAGGLSDPEVAAQTVAVIGHLADRLRTAELNQAALVDVLQAVAADSTASRSALLQALNGITERLAEAPQVNVTVPVPEVNVNVEQAGKRVVELERDSAGRLTGATTGTRTIELERDDTGKLIGAVVEEEGHDQEAA